MILRAAQMQIHEKYASWAPQFGPYAPFLHHRLQPEICKIHWKNVYFSFMAPFRKLYLASSALSHGSEAKFSFFCTASGLILWKNARRIRYFKSESSCNTCFGSPTYKQIKPIPCSASRHDFVLMQSPASDCMLPFADRKLYAEHKLQGGGVPSSEGLQLNR